MPFPMAQDFQLFCPSRLLNHAALLPTMAPKGAPKAKKDAAATVEEEKTEKSVEEEIGHQLDAYFETMLTQDPQTPSHPHPHTINFRFHHL